MADELSVAVAIIRRVCEGEPDLIERIRKAMAEAKDYWMSTNDDLRFRAAVGAALVETKDEGEKDRIVRSVQALRDLSAMISGVPVDFERVAERMSEFEPLPLVKMWHEAKAA